MTPGKARTPREQRQKGCVVDEAVEKCQMVRLRGALVERVDDGEKKGWGRWWEGNLER